MQRSIWISTEDWELIKIAAAVAKKTLSRYLLHLHKMNIASLNRPHILTPAVFVDSEELDRNPDKYPDGAIGTVPADHPSIIKKPANIHFSPRPKGQDGIKKKAK